MTLRQTLIRVALQLNHFSAYAGGSNECVPPRGHQLRECQELCRNTQNCLSLTYGEDSASTACNLFGVVAAEVPKLVGAVLVFDVNCTCFLVG